LNQENIYIFLITIFFVWGGIGFIRPDLHRKSAQYAIYWMSLSAALAILGIAHEIFIYNQFIIFGFAQALALTTVLSLFLMPILVNDKTIIAYFSPLWYLIATLALICAYFFPAENKVEFNNLAFEIHFFLSMFAYALFTIWAIVVVILLIQSSRLHNPYSVEKFKLLPPLLIIEKHSLWLGRLTLIFLTLVLISGLIYSEIIFGRIELSHKLIFTAISWIVVLIIILGQILRNWRGQKINIAILVSYGLILLAYIGYRFILEIFILSGN